MSYSELCPFIIFKHMITLPDPLATKHAIMTLQEYHVNSMNFNFTGNGKKTVSQKFCHEPRTKMNLFKTKRRKEFSCPCRDVANNLQYMIIS